MEQNKVDKNVKWVFCWVRSAPKGQEFPIPLTLPNSPRLTFSSSQLKMDLILPDLVLDEVKMKWERVLKMLTKNDSARAFQK
jgi:hypothetical protein